MTKEVLVKSVMASGVLLIISLFASLINLVNTYDMFIEESSATTAAAFNG